MSHDNVSKASGSKDKESTKMKKNYRTKKANTKKDDTSPDKPY
jgi:hypothetical protein